MRDLHVAAILAIDQAVYSAPLLQSWSHGLTPEGYLRAMGEGEDFEVAETSEGGVVAFCGVKNGEVLGLYVHPDAQGAGVGAALLERGEAQARRQRPDATFLPLNASLNAVPFYRKHGYELIEIVARPSRGGAMMQAALMRKPVRRRPFAAD